MYVPSPNTYTPPPQAYSPPQNHLISPQQILIQKSQLENLSKYSFYSQVFDSFRTQNKNTDNQHISNTFSKIQKYPHYLYDNNHIYRFEYCNGNTAYYCCVNKKVNGIKCKERRVLKDGNFEMPNQKENIMHYGDECSL